MENNCRGFADRFPVDPRLQEVIPCLRSGPRARGDFQDTSLRRDAAEVLQRKGRIELGGLRQVDLVEEHDAAAQPLGVVVGLKVADDHTHAQPAGEVG